jgi:uncharacterized membrane protein YeaQ/YmgE (transglycosylase-associated protein family)
MGILIWIMVGLVAGSVAKLVMPGPSAGGIAIAIPLGIGGALVGGLLGSMFSGGTVTGFDFRCLLMAISGALFVLLSYRSYAMRAMA